MPSGFFNGSIMFADNVRFDGGEQPGQVTSNGQLLIGSSVAPNIRVANLTSSNASITITNGPGTIDLTSSITLTGDTGSATGSTILLYANNAARNSGATVKFVNSGTTSTLNVTTPVSLNTFIGANAGTTTVSGTENTAVGSTALTAITSGVFNTAFGSRCLQSMQSGNSNTAMGLACMRDNVSGQDNAAFGDQCLTTSTASFNTCVGAKAMNGTGAGGGNNNTCIGYAAGNKLSTGIDNCFLGFQAGNNVTTGQRNDAHGYNSLNALTTGSYNVCIGGGAGEFLTSSESSNIYLVNQGVAAESNTIRIGRQGSSLQQQNRCFIAGIASVSVSNQQTVAIDSSTGQLGSYTGNPTVTIVTGDIDLKTVGNTLIFTPASIFIVVSVTAYAKTMSGTIGLPTVNIGTNAATYNNIIGGMMLSTTQGNTLPSFISLDTPAVPAATGLYIRVAVGDATATTNTQKFAITGFYL